MNENNPDLWTGTGVAFTRSTAGENVSPDTANALAAYWACKRVLAEDSAKLPIKIIREEKSGTKTEVRDVPEYELLNRSANQNSTAFTVREHLSAQALGWGNGLLEIQRLPDGTPFALHPLQSSRFDPKLDSEGRLRYWYQNDVGQKVELPAADVIHVMGPSENGIVGWPVAYWATECIGEGLAQQKFSAAFFANGTAIGGWLEHPGKLSQVARDNLQASIAKRHQGAGNAHKIGILEEGMKFHGDLVNPKDAEWIASRNFTIEEICRWFRMPPVKIQHYLQAKGWDSSEAENTYYLTETLMPWLERIEAEADRKFFPDHRLYCEHDFSRLLRANASARADYYNRMQDRGVFSINDVRQCEGLNGIGPLGDKRFIPVNMQTLERAVEGPAQVQPQLPAPQDEEKKPAPDDEKAAAAYRPFVEQSARRLLRKEGKAVARLAGKAKTGKAEFAGALADFLARHAEDMAEELAVAFRADDPPEVLVALCAGWCAQAAKEYADPERAGDVAAARLAKLPGVWAAQVLALAESVVTCAA
jgi:HK97 family phage portal protein